MAPLTDLTGRTIGKWTVVARATPNTPCGGARWRCRCACGASHVRSGASLLNGRSLSCGCSRVLDRTSVQRAAAGLVFIPLGHGRFALVNEDDAPRLARFRWTLDSHGYAVRSGRRGEPHIVRMHREVLGVTSTVDHINRDRLDNRRSNLRVATPSQNAANAKIRRNNSSGFRGVSRASRTTRSKRWLAHIRHEGHSEYLGSGATPAEAALIYDAAARKYFGSFARLNFPSDNEARAERT